MRKLQLFVIVLLVVPLATAATIGTVRYRRAAQVVPHRVVAAVPQTKERIANDQCTERRQALLEQPALPGMPALEAVRAELTARAKAEPVVFVEEPTAAGVPPSLAAIRAQLFREGVPWQALNDVFGKLKRYPKQLRQVLLTDSYLYAEKPDLAALLSGGISLSQLFTEKDLDVMRGDVTRRAQRKQGNYVWADGPEAGQLARLWLFDRVAVHGEALSAPKHVSFGELRSRLGATRIEIERLTRTGVLAKLVYGEHQVPAVLSTKDGRLAFECEVVEPESKAGVEAARQLTKRRDRTVERLLAVVAEQVEEGLPFDEPKTEEGQQDGKLRQEWRSAYLHGQHKFTFNGDDYFVFGPHGIPRIPQVCADFITDSWERMADTRWQPRDAGRGRQVGRLDFDTLGIENRRSVEHLIDFAVAHPEWFELMLIPESERVTFSDRSRFFRRLFDLRNEFQPGDVVAILGPRDDEKLHYHSFFIVASDPITAMPTLVAANAGRPRIRTWEGEMQNAPRRSIVARIRPRLEWLETIAGVASSAAPAVAEL
jgi:hypothetical protein